MFLSLFFETSFFVFFFATKKRRRAGVSAAAAVPSPQREKIHPCCFSPSKKTSVSIQNW